MLCEYNYIIVKNHDYGGHIKIIKVYFLSNKCAECSMCIEHTGSDCRLGNVFTKKYTHRLKIHVDTSI